MDYNCIRTDALVIGGGVTGYMAAYGIQKDKKVTLLATGRGASPHITGFNYVFADGDSIECFIKDSFESGRYQNDPALVKTLCEGSAKTVPFLYELGMDLDMDGDSFRAKRPVGSSFPRVIGKNNVTGGIIINLLREKLDAQDNFTAMDGTRALRLLVKNKRVMGAFCYNTVKKEFVCIEADAVILAAGGFCKVFGFNTNTEDMGADGIAMAYGAGLPLIDMEFVQFEPSGTLWPEEVAGHGMVTTVLFEGGKLLNKDGERFMFKYSEKGEQVNKDELGRGIYKEVLAGNAGPHGGMLFDCTNVPSERMHTAYELYYKRYMGCGVDITKEPIEVFPAAHTALGGVKIKPDCSTEIEGLFACGEIVGGLHGANRLGGSAGTETQVFGQIAGETAGKYLAGCGKVSAEDSDWNTLVKDFSKEASAGPMSDAEMDAARKEMGSILSDKFNVIREGKSMEEGSRRIEQILKAVKVSAEPSDKELCYKRIRLLNDLESAWLFTLCAMERKDSVGAHWRTDYESASPKPYRIEIRNQGREKPLILKTDIN